MVKNFFSKKHRKLGLQRPSFFAHFFIAFLLCIPVLVSHADQARVVDLASPSATEGDDNNDAPDNYATPMPSVDTSSMSMSQRMARVEQQTQNLAGMNLQQQISDLRDQIMKLDGQLQEQAHQIQVLTDQQKAFYQDLNQRLQQLSVNSPSGQAVAPTTATTANANDTTNAAATSTPSANSEIGIYQNALKQLQAKHFDQAQLTFQQYLQSYPQGDFAANAHYWLGEIYHSEKKLSQAESEFNTVLKQFGKANKVPDAKLKLAIIHAQQGKTDQARTELESIKDQYPGTTTAQLADVQLQRLGE